MVALVVVVVVEETVLVGVVVVLEVVVVMEVVAVVVVIVCAVLSVVIKDLVGAGGDVSVSVNGKVDVFAGMKTDEITFAMPAPLEC